MHAIFYLIFDFSLGFNEAVNKSLNTLLSCITQPKKRKFLTWKNRIENCETSWAENRNLVFEIIMKQQFCDSMCFNCMNEKAVICCKDCLQQDLCFQCDNEIHSESPYHNRCSFAHGYMNPLSPLVCLNQNLELV